MKATEYVRTPTTWYGFFLVGLQIYLFTLQGNILPFIQNIFNLSYREVSLHSIALASGIIVTGLSGRSIAGTLTRRLWLQLGTSGLTLGAILLCTSSNPWSSILSCFLIGLAGSMISSGVPALMSDLHQQNRALALSEQSIIAYGFAALGSVGMGFLIAVGLNWRLSLVFGTIIGLILVSASRRMPIPQARMRTNCAHSRLPASFWTYWAVLGSGCALEFSIVLWAPAFLARVVGFSASGAATGLSVFFVGVLSGRMLVRILLQRLSPKAILAGALAIGIVGFILYWMIATPAAAIAGLILLGLCIAPQFPMAMALALRTDAGLGDLAATRLMLAFGLAMLLAPAILGILADSLSLWIAHLTLPVLITASAFSLALASFLERRTFSGNSN